MITSDGWFDWAIRHPGPTDKKWPETNLLQGIVMHSAVGSKAGVISIVDGPAANERSVTGVIDFDGSLTQFYSIFESPWANGQHLPNYSFLGFEHAGGGYHADGVTTWYDQPLTEEQVASDVKILWDLQVFKQVDNTYWKRPLNTRDKSATAWEHKEMKVFGAAPTACPSGRIPWGDIFSKLSTMNRTWESGSESWGFERVGKQVWEWMNGVVINKYGSEDGQYPGQRYHNLGGTFLQVED